MSCPSVAYNILDIDDGYEPSMDRLPFRDRGNVANAADMRLPLSQACTPTDTIKQYACRQNRSSGKKPELKDLSEHLVENYIGLKFGSGRCGKLIPRPQRKRLSTNNEFPRRFELHEP
ncbi:unnamed protein product [Heligmosomoides polygyrus]|uniref:Uncharacterized protein n=1 Tax=Heligmosomoides polygyrus TaxID=6339 RepID=A0A183FJX9_HELPZ|nr:unnamed protein product [Heligmosomoides polygyrus]